MNELSSIDVKASLIGLICDTIPYFRSKHHLVAIHVVKHYVFKRWLEGFFVNKIKVYLKICRNLDSNISLDIEYETPNVRDHVIHLPLSF